MSDSLMAFRIVDGPCRGEIAELPTEGYDEVWRFISGSIPATYALYQRDGAVFRYAGVTKTMRELVDHIEDVGAKATLHADSREYER